MEGNMKTRELTCIVCPRGCALSVTLDDNGAVTDVKGNICPRGKAYALDECTNPRRVVTTTARCADGSVIAVKTKESVPKSLVFEVMKVINKTVVADGAAIGDVVIEDVAGSGVAVVVTGKHA